MIVMKEVKENNLISGKEYYLECYTIYKKDNKYEYHPAHKRIAKFFNLEDNNFNQKIYNFNNFRYIKYEIYKNKGYDVNLHSNYWKFYEIIKNKVQKDMEKRAYDIILQQIIKDKYFKLDFL